MDEAISGIRGSGLIFASQKNTGWAQAREHGRRRPGVTQVAGAPAPVAPRPAGGRPAIHGRACGPAEGPGGTTCSSAPYTKSSAPRPRPRRVRPSSLLLPASLYSKPADQPEPGGNRGSGALNSSPPRPRSAPCCWVSVTPPAVTATAR